MATPYEDDVLAWSEHQARLLRQLAGGQPGNEAPDWDNIIEAVESVGRSQLNAVPPLLVQALAHDLRVQAWPGAGEMPHRQAEARAFRDDARDACTPSMRHNRLPESLDGQAPLPLPADCAATLDQLLGA